MSNVQESYIDADAPFSADELAEAAIVLALVNEAPQSGPLERRLRADAKAYFDARRKPRAATTTSGTEVVIVEGEASSVPVREARSRWWAAGWIAAAASVAIGVFAARARTLPATASFHDETFAHAQIEVDASTSLVISGLAPAPQGCHYVLWVRPSAGMLRRLESFSETSHHHPGAPTSGAAAVTLENASGSSRRVVATRTWGRAP